MLVGARFVQGYLSLIAHPQQQDVDSARRLDCGLVSFTIVAHPVRRYRAVQRVYLRSGNIHLVDQLFVQRIGIALLFRRIDRIEFEQGEDHHVFETQPFVLVTAYQFAVHADRRFSGRQGQHAFLPGGGFGLDRLGDFGRHAERAVLGRSRDVGRDTLEPRDDIHRFGAFLEAPFGLELVVCTHSG